MSCPLFQPLKIKADASPDEEEKENYVSPQNKLTRKQQNDDLFCVTSNRRRCQTNPRCSSSYSCSEDAKGRFFKVQFRRDLSIKSLFC